MEKELLNDVIEWDVVNWGRALGFWQKTEMDFRNAKVLDIGSRNGGLSLWFALKGAEVVCSDLSGPTDQARRLHEKYGVADKIKYETIDAMHIPYKSYFDAVVFKSVLGGIGCNNHPECQRTAINEIRNAINFENGKGHLFFVENLTSSSLHKYLRNKYVPWGNCWRYVGLNELLDMLCGFQKIEYRTSGFLGAFGRNPGQRNILGHLDGVLDRFIPQAYRYIVYGIASGKKN